MSTGGYLGNHQQDRHPATSLSCSLAPPAEEIEALAFDISSQHPDWSLNYCELRAKVEYEKRAT